MNTKIPIDDEVLLNLRHGRPKDRDKLKTLVQADPTLGDRLAEWDRQDAALATLYNAVGDEAVPERHRSLIAAAAVERKRSFHVLARIAAAIVLVAFGATAGWFTARHQLPGAAETDLSTAALRAYATYSVEVAHPVEVLAADEAHLEGWLSKRIGRPIAPPNLSSTGFHLLGGRVVPDANGTAALMMYENDLGQRVTLYIAPSLSNPETALRFASSDSARGYSWVDNQLGCALVGDLPRDILRQISLVAYEQIDPA